MKKDHDLIDIIDTETLSKNIIANANSSLSSYEEQVLIRLLESQSYTAQMACKTHEVNITPEENKRYSFMQKKFENTASENIQLLGRYNTKIVRYAIAYSFLGGVLLGAASTLTFY